MSTEQKSLWGEMPDIDNRKTPLSILHEQASFLEKMTKGLLIGRVVTGEVETIRGGARMSRSGRGYVAEDEPEEQVIDFFIVVPALNDYSYRLLRVEQPILTYPLRIYAHDRSALKVCKGISEFREALENILSSEETTEILANLLAQAKS